MILSPLHYSEVTLIQDKSLAHKILTSDFEICPKISKDYQRFPNVPTLINDYTNIINGVDIH